MGDRTESHVVEINDIENGKIDVIYLYMPHVLVCQPYAILMFPSYNINSCLKHIRCIESGTITFTTVFDKVEFDLAMTYIPSERFRYDYFVISIA